MRDLLKGILEKILSIPNTVSSAVVQQLLAAREVNLLSGATYDTEVHRVSQTSIFSLSSKAF